MTSTMDVTAFTNFLKSNVPADLRLGAITNVNNWLNSGKGAAIYADNRRSISDVANPACILVSFGSGSSMLGETSNPPTTLPDNSHYQLVGVYTGPVISTDNIS